MAFRFDDVPGRLTLADDVAASITGTTMNSGVRSGTARRHCLVIPCHDEASRLNASAFLAFVDTEPEARLLFVDDGSRDQTVAVLEAIRAAANGRVDVLHLEHNRGKAEAVRLGMLHALETDVDFVGFWDADLATPLSACATLVDHLRERPLLDVVMGSRVAMLGRTIERRAVRHYAGRIFATAAAITLGVPVYDTQCGAKLFRVSPRLARVLASPFVSTWAFDVEILARYGGLASPYSPDVVSQSVDEVPLLEWRHVAGSKVRPWDLASALLDLARIYRAHIRPGRRIT
jgi:glycosyltransferase involved in cell wall biosynthesis